MGLNRWLGCIENPRTGREAVDRRPRPAGAGGSWWSAAGRAGCRPRSPPPSGATGSSLFERHDRLGGQVHVAAGVPSRAEFLDIARNLIVAARRVGVDLRTGVEADRRPGAGARRPTW